MADMLEQKNKKPRSRVSSSHNYMTRLGLSGLALIIVISILAGFGGGWLGSRNLQRNNSANTAQAQRIVSNESQLISDIAKNVGPSVVSVNVISQAAAQQSIFGISSTPVQQQSAGTGIIISSDGVIVTNRHVVPLGSTDVKVTLSDGTQLSNVEVIGRTNDSDTLDVAFLKIKDKKGKTLKPARLGNSNKMQVGDKVVAIGNALGQFQNTVTSGIISGYGRNLQATDQTGISSESLQDLFQTDAAINEGNSGGPLVNLNGEVIGINTAVAGGQAQNIGFAIPIDNIKGLITSVLRQGKLLRPYLGVHYVSLTDDYAYQFNLNVKRGAYVAPSADGQSPIISGSPADKAGLKEKDIIIKADGVSIDENNSLSTVLGKHSVGDTVTLTISRDGKQITKNVRLEAAPTN